MPEKLINFGKLKILSMSFIENILFPEFITELVELEELYFSIKHSKKFIKYLIYCKMYLFCFKNSKYTFITSEIKKLKKLQILSLINLNIKEFPVEIAQLNNLKLLDLKNNSITSVPDSIRTLEELNVLDMRYNMLLATGEGFNYGYRELRRIFRDKFIYSDDNMLEYEHSKIQR